MMRGRNGLRRPERLPELNMHQSGRPAPSIHSAVFRMPPPRAASATSERRVFLVTEPRPSTAHPVPPKRARSPPPPPRSRRVRVDVRVHVTRWGRVRVHLATTLRRLFERR